MLITVLLRADFRAGREGAGVSGRAPRSHPFQYRKSVLPLNPPKCSIEEMIYLVKNNLRITYVAKTTFFMNE